MPDVFIGIILGSILLGLYLFFRGWYHREHDGGMYCRRCQYRVDQAQSPRCPECGVDLAEHAPVTGRPVRQTKVVVTGLGLAAIGAGFLGVHVSGMLERIDIYKLVPTWYLFKADVSGANGFATRETDELRRRALEQRLDPDQVDTLARYLARRATNMWSDPALQGPLSFSGLTLRMLKDQNVPEELLTPLLQSVLDHEARAGDIHRLLLSGGGNGEGHVIVLNESPAPFDDPNQDLTMEVRFCAVDVTQGKREISVDRWIPGQRLPGWGLINWTEPFDVKARIEFRIGNTSYPQQINPFTLPTAPVGPGLGGPGAGMLRQGVLHPMDQISEAWQSGSFTIHVPGVDGTELSAADAAELTTLWVAAEAHLTWLWLQDLWENGLPRKTIEAIKQRILTGQAQLPADAGG